MPNLPINDQPPQGPDQKENQPPVSRPSALPGEGTTFSKETPVVQTVSQESRPETKETASSPPKPPDHLTGPSQSPGSEGLPGENKIFQTERRSSLSRLKKIIPLILIAFVGLGLVITLFRRASSRLSKTKAATLTYWGLWEPEGVMKEILADWEKKHPKIKVVYSQQSINEYRERLQSALARGEGPDIFRFHNTWLPMLKNELAPVPATVMDAGSFERNFYPAAVASLRSGTDYLGLPLEIDTLALFYNQDFFQAAGVNPPQTWDELRQTAFQLTVRDENGRIQRAGVALGTTGNIRHWSDILGLMMLQNGADLSNPTGSLAEDALTFYTLFAKTDRVWDGTLPESLLAFATGKVAMFFGYSWDVFEIKSINPNLNFKITTVPQLSSTKVNWASFWVEGVAAKSKNQAAAWEFLQFLTSPEVMQKLYQAESRLRLFGEPYSRVEMANLLQSDPMVGPFLAQAPTAQSWYLCSRTFDNGINDRLIKYFEDAVNAVNNGQSSQEALATAAKGVAQILSQYGLRSYVAR